MVEPQEVEHGGVEVVDMNRVFGRAEAEFVGRAMDIAALDSTTRQLNGEAVVVMVASFAFAGRAGRGNFDGGSASKFAAANDQRFI